MIRAYANPALFGGGVAISFVDLPEPGSYPSVPRILRIGCHGDGSQSYEWEEFDPHMAGPEPTLRVGMEAALALAEALAELQHGTAEHRALRKDYDAERGRVDRLIETLSTVAKAAPR